MRFTVLALALIITGCVHTHPLSLSSPEGRVAVTARAVRGHAVIRLDGEPPRAVRDLTVDADTTRWTDHLSDRARAEPTARVRSVAFRRDGRGALADTAIGAGLGVALGAAVAADDRGFFQYSLAQGLALSVPAGALWGALVGTMRSDRVFYRRAAPAEAP